MDEYTLSADPAVGVGHQLLELLVLRPALLVRDRLGLMHEPDRNIPRLIRHDPVHQLAVVPHDAARDAQRGNRQPPPPGIDRGPDLDAVEEQVRVER